MVDILRLREGCYNELLEIHSRIGCATVAMAVSSELVTPTLSSKLHQREQGVRKRNIRQ